MGHPRDRAARGFLTNAAWRDTLDGQGKRDGTPARRARFIRDLSHTDDPTMYKLSRRSWKNLHFVRPELIGVVSVAIQITEVDFTVIEGLRTLERQQELYAAGASETLNSRHLHGEAVDLAAWVDGDVSWHKPYYRQINTAMAEAAQRLGVQIVWGGNWKTLRDGPHFQLA